MGLNICNKCLTFLTTAVGAPGATSVVMMSLSTLRRSKQLSMLIARNLATKVKTEQENSRQESRLEKAVAQEKFPYLPTKSTKQVYVLDKALAGVIARAVRENQVDPTAPVLEANPGPGVLTKALLKSGVERIVLAESLKPFIPLLEVLQKKHKNSDVTLYNWDYLFLWRRLAETDCPYKNHEDRVMELLPHKEWMEGPPVTVVGVLPEGRDAQFLTHLLMSFARQYGLFVLGRPEWFIVLSPRLHSHLLVAKKGEKRLTAFYTRLAIVLHLVFDFHLCAELPAWKFTPHFPEKRRKSRLLQELSVSAGSRYLLRLRPHAHQALPFSQILAFSGFLSQVMKRKKQRLIPKMEQLVPGCGVHLIMSGFSILMLIVDVSPVQFLDIFKAMQTWPEYEGSPMKLYLAESATADFQLDDDNVDDSQKQD